MTTRRSSSSYSASVIFLILLVISPPAWSWNAAGHRLVACIAWDHLGEHARSGVTPLLREHPDYERWAKKGGEGNPDRIAFIEASTWADDIRKDARFYSVGVDEPTPLLSGFPDMERHGNWHYVNRLIDDLPPDHPRTEPVSGLIHKQLVAQTRTLGSLAAPRTERIYALPWLIHLTGDAHQPLHTSLRLGPSGKWDKLGNELTVTNPFNPRKNSSTLHAFWDDLPGPPWLRGERLEAACRALVARHPRPAISISSDQWIDESWQIARQSGYPASEEATPTISEAFFRNSREIANRRVTEAGYRLADVLNSLFGEIR